MWYLVVNQNSERFFIKQRKENFCSSYYIVSEQDKELKTINHDKLKQWCQVVGEAFENEQEWLNKLVEEVE